MRRAALLALLVVLAASLAACGEREEVRDEVLAAIARTERLSYRFAYVDDRAENVIPEGAPPLPDAEVQGLIEDDFRFKARVSLNDSTAFDEVVRDDLLAVRFLDPGRLGVLVNKDKVEEENSTTELEGVDSLSVLQSRRWVVDETAAPIVTVGRVREETLGQDPVLDAVTAFSYVAEAVRSAQEVQEYSPDDVTPAYSATEDDFPKPEDGSGVTRYDLRRPKLPPPGGDQASGEAGRPATRHFRRMAIYVKDDRVIQVRETIDVRGKFLKDVVKYAKTFAKASGASPDQVAEFSDALDAVPEEQRGSLVLEGLSAALSAVGDQPILRREMSLELTDLATEIAVDLPTQDVVKGGLGFLIVSATGKVEDEAADSGDTGTGAPAGSGTVAEGGAGAGADDAGGGTDTPTTAAPSP
ncbi:MAG TPA: hypothetical protein VM933_03795 [Acidimicrobiales bacterium]|nr:hypothetical protein [Acidimicrobiales bacterium]